MLGLLYDVKNNQDKFMLGLLQANVINNQD